MRAGLAILLLGVGLAPAVATAKAPPAPKPQYHVEIKGVEAVPAAPANLAGKAKQVLGEVLAARPEFVATLEGAPDPAADAAGYKSYLAKNHLRSFGVTIHVSDYQRTLEPNPKANRSGQVLTIRVGVSLLGTAIPDELLAISGEGSSTVAAEVGKNLRPREEEQTIDDALRDALTHAVDEAVTKLKSAKEPKKRR
jgi:hypothetical protein